MVEIERRYERTAPALDDITAERLALGDELVEVTTPVDVDAKQRLDGDPHFEALMVESGRAREVNAAYTAPSC